MPGEFSLAHCKLLLKLMRRSIYVWKLLSDLFEGSACNEPFKYFRLIPVVFYFVYLIYILEGIVLIVLKLCSGCFNRFILSIFQDELFRSSKFVHRMNHLVPLALVINKIRLIGVNIWMVCLIIFTLSLRLSKPVLSYAAETKYIDITPCNSLFSSTSFTLISARMLFSYLSVSTSIFPLIACSAWTIVSCIEENLGICLRITVVTPSTIISVSMSYFHLIYIHDHFF